MDYEREVISRVLEYPEEIITAIDQQITPLFTGEGAKPWKWILDFFRDNGVVPSKDAFESAFPTFDLEGGQDPIMFYVGELRKLKVFNAVRTSIGEAADRLKEKEPFEAVKVLRKTILEVDQDIRPSRDVDWTQNPEARYQKYLSLREINGVEGLPFLWDTLNDLTQGVGDEDLIFVVARTAIGKTWWLVLWAHFLWTQRKIPLLITKEMSVEHILRRLDAAHFTLPYDNLRKGKLGQFVEEGWESGFGSLEETQPLWISGDDEQGGVSGVAAKVEMYKPDIVMVDGGYFLVDEHNADSQWQRIVNISRDLKRLARRKKIPVVVSWQLSKEATNTKGSARNIKFADISMDAQLVIGLFQSEDQFIAKELDIRILKQTEGTKGSLLCRWDYDNMEFYEIPSEESAIEETSDTDEQISF